MQNSLNENEKPLEESSNEKPVIDLATPGITKALAKRILEDIDTYCQTYDDGHRWHLGASLIGNECSRYLWYIFRWCQHEKFSGRMCRLFDRGHREEARFIEWLRGIGCEVWDVQEDGKTQFRITDCNGHFGGSLDGICKFPKRYQIDEPVLLEFKTHNTGRGWAELNSMGMAVNKPKHYAQTSTYGPKYKLRYVLYMSINKNDDDIYLEVVKLDANLGEQMIAKAERIICSHEAPARLSDNPAYQTCSWCPLKEMCHFHKAPEKNCRSCINAYPVENAEWNCTQHNAIIPRDFVPTGCDFYKAITESNAI
jgi:hypothetical protein